MYQPDVLFNSQLIDDQGQLFSFKERLRASKWLLLYFYPKDLTPGCTMEGLDFKAHYADFKALGVEVVGVSADTSARHALFKSKCHFPFPLLADTDHVLCKLFDVYQKKSMFGKSYMGIERSTFLLNAEGEICNAWSKVKVKGHVAAVLKAIKELEG